MHVGESDLRLSQAIDIPTKNKTTADSMADHIRATGDGRREYRDLHIPSIFIEIETDSSEQKDIGRLRSSPTTTTSCRRFDQ